MERREFVRLLLASGVSLHGLGTLGCATAPVVTSPGHSKGKIFVAMAGPDPDRSILRIWDWDTGTFVDHTLPISLAHSFMQDRVRPNILTAFEAFGSCARIDLATGKTTKIDHRRREALFHGHGVQIPSEDLILCTEMDAATGKGVVGIRSNKTLEKVGQAPSETNNAHQVALLPNSTTVVCGNMNKADGSMGGGIAFFDYSTGKIIKRIDLDMPVSHVLPLSKSEAVGLSVITRVSKGTPKSASEHFEASSGKNILDHMYGTVAETCPLYYAKTDGTQKAFIDPARKELFNGGFALAAVRGSQRFLTSYPVSNCVLLWKDLAVEKVFPVANPWSLVVSADGKEFMVTSKGRVKRFSLETHAELPAPEGFRKVSTFLPCLS